MKKKKPRIAIFTHNYPANSKERKDAGIFVYDFAHELAKYSDVFIFCPDFAGEKEDYKKVPVTWLNWGGPTAKFGSWKLFSPKSVFNFFKLIIIGSKQAEKFVKVNNIDYCLAAWIIPSAIYTTWIKLKLGTPCGIWILGSDANKYAKIPILRQLTIFSLKKADSRFSNSYWLINIVEKLSGKKCNYMDAITKFDDISKIKPKKFSSKCFNFLFVSRLEMVKGPDILLSACRELVKINSNFHLHILGDGSMRQKLENNRQEWGLSNKVTFYGVASKTKVASFMKGADSLVVASRTESIPLVMIEAARASLPTVTTDVGDCRKAIEEYNIGYFAESENPVSLAYAMSKAVQEGKNFKTKRQAGLKQIAKSRSQRKAVMTLIKEIRNTKK